MQLHVELENSQYEQFRNAIKELGYRTMSEFVREKVRWAIQEARAHRTRRSHREVQTHRKGVKRRKR